MLGAIFTDLNDKPWRSVFISIASAPNLCVCDLCFWQIISLKDQYFAELNELFNKISLKLQHVDSIIPRQMPSEQYERMKSFKEMLDRILQLLQISKSDIQPFMRDKVPRYEKQIISILNSQRRKPVQQEFLQVQMNPYKGCSLHESAVFKF